MFDLIAFDADDTLWHSETAYLGAAARFKQLLSAWCSGDVVERALYQAEVRNLAHFGYGVKAFTLAMMETAIDLTDGRIPASELQHVIELAREMLEAPVELLAHAEATLAELAQRRPLMLVTKGDLLEQEAKVDRSGLAPYFKHIEIVGDKTAERYAAVLDKYQLKASGFLMVGNSLRSDILPVLALGGSAVYIPYEMTWAHESVAESAAGRPGYYELAHLGLLPALIDSLVSVGGNARE